MNIEYGIEEGIAAQKRRDVYEEARTTQIARLARNGDAPSRIRAFFADVLHTDHTREKEA